MKPSISMHPRAHYKSPNIYDNIVGKPLTDKVIAKYEREGWYRIEQKMARKQRAERRYLKERLKQVSQEDNGNFQIVDGRLIYSPK